jgi:hypothetical protein
MDLSSIPGVDNAPTLYLRLTEYQEGAEGGGPVMPGGTSTVDNFTISGTASVPEPPSILLLGVAGAIGLICYRRSRKAKSVAIAPEAV